MDKKELKKIEARVDEILEDGLWMDDAVEDEMDSYIKKLERSYRETRIKEIGLRLVLGGKK